MKKKEKSALIAKSRVERYLEKGPTESETAITLIQVGFPMLNFLDKALSNGPWFVIALLAPLIAYEAVRGKKGS